MLDVISQYWVPIVIGAVVAGLFIWFCVSYPLPARRFLKSIRSTLELDIFRNAGITNSLVNKRTLDQHFSEQDEPFKTPLLHAWQMYTKTLHDQKRNSDGEMRVVGYRSTAPSESFFSHSLLVDTPLNVEFFKHLAGIMTGIGIIGTFGGLIYGLSKFDPAGDPANIQNSLALLLHGVRDAFVASGIAISLAMITIAIEKYYIKKCYAELERLNTAIDRLFDADEPGEEYLEKLVKSAEDNATQTKQLKDSLVDDLKVMMENLTAANQQAQQELAQRLIEASAQNSRDIATQVSQSITDALQAPLEKIAGSVEKVSGDQGSAVQDLLTDVLTAFMNRLESTFGSQMNGMNEMMSQSVNAMREMQHGFTQLIADMRNTSEASSQALEQQMVKMLTEIQQKQNEMGNAMNDMLQQVQRNVVDIGDTGAKAAQQMNTQIVEMINQMDASIAAMMTEIGQKRIEQDRVVMENQQALHQTTQGMLDSLTAQITRLLDESQLAIQSYRQNVDKLSQVSTASITGMNEGAEKMRLAAERFNTAGQALSNITEGSSALLSQINTISGSLTNTTNQLRTLVSDYQQSRDSVNQAIQTLEKLIAVAQQEAGMSSQMLGDMQRMTQALKTLQQDMQQYLGQVNDVLVKGFDSFGNAVESSLSRALGSFDNTLDQAVSRLSGGIESLGEVTEELAEMAQRNMRRA